MDTFFIKQNSHKLKNTLNVNNFITHMWHPQVECLLCYIDTKSIQEILFLLNTWWLVGVHGHDGGIPHASFVRQGS
jgi:hypothetical protein